MLCFDTLNNLPLLFTFSAYFANRAGFGVFHKLPITPTPDYFASPPPPFANIFYRNLLHFTPRNVPDRRCDFVGIHGPANGPATVRCEPAVQVKVGEGGGGAD